MKRDRIDLQSHGAVLIAKLTSPKAAHLLNRPRLFERLDEARRYPAIWISAPPGFGKTSLASSYIQNKALNSLWYRIDEEDADIGNFFYYLRQAGEHMSCREQALPEFTTENLPSLTAFARRFFECLYKQLCLPALLIFDDYHEVAGDSSLHEILAKAAEGLPEQVNMIFLSREPPPTAFARLRVHGDLIQLDAELLRFTPVEAQSLANAKGIQCTDTAMIIRANEFAVGWAAGLTLLLERGNLPLPQPFANTDTMQVLFDYFSQEFFSRLQPTSQRLLMHCALLPELPVAAVQQLTRENAVVHFLDELSTKNYFTTRHEREGLVYCFHPLFRAFLLNRATKFIDKEEFSELNKQAASILAKYGHIEDAVTLLRECENWDSLVEIILEHAEAVSHQHRLKLLASWIEWLPETKVEQSAWLLYWLGSCQLPFNPTVAKATLHRAYSLFETRQDVVGIYQCWAAIATSHNFTWPTKQEAQSWVSTFDNIQTRYPNFPSRETEARVIPALVGLLRHYSLNYSHLQYWLSRSENLLSLIADNATRLLIATELAWCYSWLGKAVQGESLMRESAYLVTSGIEPLARLNWYLVSAIYARHRADVAACKDAVEEGLRIADESEVHVVDLYLCVLGMYGTLNIGDLDAAMSLQQRISLTHRAQKLDISAFHHIQSMMNLHLGNFVEAGQHARNALAPIEASGVILPCFLNRLFFASSLMEAGRLEEANEQLELALQLRHGVDSEAMSLMYLLGKALLELKRDCHSEALAILHDAINSARQSGGHYPPLYYRKSLTALFSLGLEANMNVDAIQDMIRSQRLIPNDVAQVTDNWPWPIRIFTFGRFCITKDGVPLKVGAKASHKPMHLLKVLIAYGGRDVPQEKLFSSLWPDTDGDDAHHAFETTLYRLRKLLGSEILLVKDGRLTLNPSYCWVDCWLFEQLLDKLDLAITSNNISDISQLTERLLNTYQGSFLGHDDEIPAAIGYAERLRSRLLRMLDKLGAYWTAHGNQDRTCEYYLLALEVEPRTEIFYQRLMQQYLLCGRYAEAITIYQRCRHILHSLLGVAPSTETQSLYTTIITAAKSDATKAEAS